jgi:hypothetical protein
MTIKEFNEQNGTYIEANASYEKYFKGAYDNARKMVGRADFITAKLYGIEETGWVKNKMRDAAGAACKKLPKGKMKDAACKKERQYSKEIEEELRKKASRVAESSLDDALGEGESKEPTRNFTVENIVLNSAKDKANFDEDMKHLIQFDVPGMNVSDTLLKGRPRYLQALKDFLKGDKTVEIKMSYRQKNKTIRVADLKPDVESLKKLLKSKPEGLRVVKCL